MRPTLRMTTALTTFVLLCSMLLPANLAMAQNAPETKPQEKDELVHIQMDTTHGLIVLALNKTKAPETVANFVSYTEEKFYDNSMIHRLTKRNIYVLQGGGYSEKGERKKVKKPVVNEYKNGLKNDRGTISMARTRHPDSATSQFFLNYRDNNVLDNAHPSYGGAAYCVFGEIIHGMDVIDAMAKTPTGAETVGGAPMRDVPTEPITLQKVRVVSEAEAMKAIEADKAKKADEKKDADADKRAAV